MVKFLVVSAACWMTSISFSSTVEEHPKKPKLSQLDYIYLHMVQSALGKPAGLANTPDVEVQVANDLVFLDPPLNTQAELAVQVVVDNPTKTQALATLVTQVQDCAGIFVHVYVTDFQGNRVAPGNLPSTPEAARKLFTDALTGNWYFLRIQSGSRYVPFFVEVRYVEVQYFNDSLLSRIACGSRTSGDVFTQLCQVERLGQAGARMSISSELVIIPPPAKKENPVAAERRKTLRETIKGVLRACSHPFSCCYHREEEI